MIKKYKLIIFVFISMFVFNSCFRELPNDKFSDEQIWSSALQLDGYVTPWYRNMSHGFSFYMPSMALAKSETRDFLPWYGDQIIISKNDWYSSAYGDIMKGDQLQLQLYASRIWAKHYTQLRSINYLLQNSHKIKEGDHKNRVLGEAHFFRAYYYFQLLRRFGGVLLLEEPYNPLESPVKHQRASFEEMVQFITREATLAAELLPAEMIGSNQGRVTKGAALTLKGKTLFWAAGIRFQNQQKAWLGFQNDRSREMLEAAKLAYDDVMRLNYQLVQLNGTTRDQIAQDYRRIFNTKFTSESILEVNHSDNGDFADAFGHKLDREAASPYFTGTTAANVPTENHFNEYRAVNGLKTSDPASGYDPSKKYEGLDYRFYANVLYDGVVYNGHKMDIHYRYEGGSLVPGVDLQIYGSSTTAAYTATGYYLAKFRKEEQTIDNNDTYASSQNYIIWRYADVLLDYAEAEFLLGNTSSALSYVNQIRRRAKVQEWATLSWDDLMNERRVELAFEETTYWDVIRQNQAVEKLSYRTPVMGIRIIQENNGEYSYTPFKVHARESSVRNFFERQYFFCIPWDEIRYHQIEQNPDHVEN